MPEREKREKVVATIPALKYNSKIKENTTTGNLYPSPQDDPVESKTFAH